MTKQKGSEMCDEARSSGQHAGRVFGQLQLIPPEI